MFTRSAFHGVGPLVVVRGVVASQAVELPPFSEFLEQHKRTVYRFLTAAVGPHEADDAFQETFVAALRAYPRLTDASKLDRWVLRIASRKAIDHHRAAGRRAIPSGDLPEHAASPAGRPELDGDLRAAVASLPPKQRVAVVHRHVLDRSYADVADVMGISEEAARANVYQGVKKLRELMT
jgi:RNA polymerase sigma factor (sigma-70 family)